MNRVVHRIFLPNGNVVMTLKLVKSFLEEKDMLHSIKMRTIQYMQKSGSIIPLAILDEEDLNNTKPPKKLEIQVFPGVSNNYNLYEDDGISNLYKEGYYILTNIDYNYRMISEEQLSNLERIIIDKLIESSKTLNLFDLTYFYPTYIFWRNIDKDSLDIYVKKELRIPSNIPKYLKITTNHWSRDKVMDGAFKKIILKVFKRRRCL